MGVGQVGVVGGAGWSGGPTSSTVVANQMGGDCQRVSVTGAGQLGAASLSWQGVGHVDGVHKSGVVVGPQHWSGTAS